MADKTIKTLHPFLQENTTNTASGSTVKSFSHDRGSGPVLCLVHGWPQSSYMWRHVVADLKDRISLFVVDLPGYGFSSLPPKHDKRTVGNLVIEALQQVFGKDRPIIWCGHDRGARVGHRVIVDADPSHNIQAAIFMDIVPTVEQWRVFANPAASKAYWHWPFLAMADAPFLIERMGGGTYVQAMLQKAKGSNPAGVELFKRDDAISHYCHQFSQPECIAGSCADYASASAEEPEEQEQDQQNGKKVKVPLLVVYSASNLGRMHDVPSVWKKWADGELECVAIPEGYGHYLPEECPEKTLELVTRWIDKYEK